MPAKRKAIKNEDFDFALARIEDDPYALGYDVTRCIQKRGFCILDGGLSKDDLSGVVDELKDLQAKEKFKRPPNEILDGLLGAEGTVNMYSMDTQEMMPENSTKLDDLDSKIFTFGAMMEPHMKDHLRFQSSTRTPAWVLEAGVEPSEEPPQLSPTDCWKWLNIFKWHRMMCVFNVGPGTGTLELKPFDDISGDHTVTMRPGMWVILRADWLHHKFVPSGQAWTLNAFLLENSETEGRRSMPGFPMCPNAQYLDEWISGAAKHLKENLTSEDELLATAGREVQKYANHLYHKGMQVAIRGMSCRLPGVVGDAVVFRSQLFMGTDCGERIPYMRWDNEKFYRVEPQDGYTVRDTYNCEHGSFMEGIELFDHKFFGLSLSETRGMDPAQRQMMEICYEVCADAGYKKNQLMRQHFGIFTGGPAGVSSEWGSAPKVSESGGALGGTSSSPAILSNRLSYTFGMNGPNFLIDLDGASSLLSFTLGVDACQPMKAQCNAAVCLGIDTIIDPSGYNQWCWAGLMSPRGRCLTFDHTADGYIRCEGGGGCFISSLVEDVDGEMLVDEHKNYIAICSGTYSNNSGKVASLSAPSGQGDQELLTSALRRADISPLDIDSIDCHGIGSLLSDAVEVTAMCKAYRSHGDQVHPEVVMVGAIKSAMGNAKPASGTIALIKTIISLNLGYALPTAHLMRINPHMLLEDMPVSFGTEHVPNRMNSSFGSCTCKGHGGTNVNCIFWANRDWGVVARPVERMKREQILYWPGGGGDLAREAQPSRGYMIVGSWKSWSELEPMQFDGKEAWTYTVTLGEHLLEKFRICLDGDWERVLHPGATNAGSDIPVCGPNSSKDTEGSCWAIDGRIQHVWQGMPPGGAEGAPLALEDDANYLALPSPDQGAAGEQYLIKLMVNGQYRLVTWEKVVEPGPDDTLVPATADVPAGKYYVTASWNDWAYEEMVPDESMPGVYHLEGQLLDRHGEFNIVRNKDWHQVIYPARMYADSDNRLPVIGPDEHGRGFEWLVEGKRGDVFMIDLQRAYEYNTVTMEVTWRRLRSEKLTEVQELSLKRKPYYITTSLDSWLQRHRMVWDGEHYIHRIEIPGGGSVNFQILQDGHRDKVLHPSMEDAGSKDTFRIVGPSVYGSDMSWKIGKYIEEQGGVYEVQLDIKHQVPTAVAWVRR
mmetsp:Transcript_106072/g.300088  ORF Transcript_106072/g.300088 Transcript_106072/m.300088 type:complete len:1165 (-) Transcript_106072:187-3681(-)